ncbi:hypothetical protein [Cohnella soli]|uniref:Uncharacterized protein n=1 Tax=Cohnella soli TaxID=425005 RepID=A0ABW0HQZ6_9BACL
MSAPAAVIRIRSSDRSARSQVSCRDRRRCAGSADLQQLLVQGGSRAPGETSAPAAGDPDPIKRSII